MISIKQIASALASLGIPTEHTDRAVEDLRLLLVELDNVSVKGRQNVDTLLGCMMAIEAIIGKEVSDGK